MKREKNGFSLLSPAPQPRIRDRPQVPLSTVTVLDKLVYLLTINANKSIYFDDDLPQLNYHSRIPNMCSCACTSPGGATPKQQGELSEVLPLCPPPYVEPGCRICISPRSAASSPQSNPIQNGRLRESQRETMCSRVALIGQNT